jgi:ATP-dependent Clp protease ATP-binding subunit ClpC
MLALIREGEGVAVAVLRSLSVDLEMIRQKIEENITEGTAAASDPDLPYTSRAKEVLQFAMSEADDLNDCYVGTEHLLLGLLRHGKGILVQLLSTRSRSAPNRHARPISSWHENASVI